jgi:hypothetical protein
MYAVRLIVTAVALAGLTGAQERVSFPTQDRGRVYADVYGEGDRGVVLAHGGRFTWAGPAWEDTPPLGLSSKPRPERSIVW